MESIACTTLILIFLAGCNISGFSQQNADTILLNKINTPYIEKQDSIISLKINVNSEFEEFKVDGDNFYYDIRPNISVSNKISVAYRRIIVGLTFTPSFYPGNHDYSLKGKTQARAIGFKIFGDHLTQEMEIAKAQGFYLYNTGDYMQGWVQGEDPYIQFPDLKVISLRGSTGYKINPNYSLKAISTQTEIQLKSSGSLIPYLVYDFFSIDNQSADTNQSSSQRSNNFDAIAGLGYGYTFVIKSWFFVALGVSPGIGLQYTNLLTRLPEGDVNTKFTNLVFSSREKAGLGYNSTKLFAGMELSFAHFLHNENNSAVQVKAFRTFYQVYIGYRIKAPRFIKKKTDQAIDVLPPKLQEPFK